jgi:hypothetical protein
MEGPRKTKRPWRYSTPFLSTGSVAMLSHDMQRKVFNVDKPPARGKATMNFISAPHRSHFRAGFSSVFPVPITEHYARSARTWLQNVKVSHNQKGPLPDRRHAGGGQFEAAMAPHDAFYRWSGDD